MAMVELAHRKMPVYDDTERRQHFERMWAAARAAAVGVDAVGVPALDGEPVDVGAVLDADETVLPWWWA